jgi:hypothetical protein
MTFYVLSSISATIHSSISPFIFPSIPLSIRLSIYPSISHYTVCFPLSFPLLFPLSLLLRSISPIPFTLATVYPFLSPSLYLLSIIPSFSFSPTISSSIPSFYACLYLSIFPLLSFYPFLYMFLPLLYRKHINCVIKWHNNMLGFNKTGWS